MNSTCRIGIAALVLVTSVTAAPALKDRPKESPIVGVWETEKSIITGPGTKKVATFMGGGPHWTFTADGRWIDETNGAGRFTIDPKESPTVINLSGPPDGPTGRPPVRLSGTFQVEGDKLIITFPTQPGGLTTATTTFRRIKKD